MMSSICFLGVRSGTLWNRSCCSSISVETDPKFRSCLWNRIATAKPSLLRPSVWICWLRLLWDWNWSWSGTGRNSWNCCWLSVIQLLRGWSNVPHYCSSTRSHKFTISAMEFFIQYLSFSRSLLPPLNFGRSRWESWGLSALPILSDLQGLQLSCRRTLILGSWTIFWTNFSCLPNSILSATSNSWAPSTYFWAPCRSSPGSSPSICGF